MQEHERSEKILSYDVSQMDKNAIVDELLFVKNTLVTYHLHSFVVLDVT